MEVRSACHPHEWHDAAQMLFAYQSETAVDLGQVAPDRPEDVWEPLRAEVTDPASAFSTYLMAYEGRDALGGVALVAYDALSVMLKRCYVRPQCRRQGVARALVAAAEDEAARRGAARLVLDIIASRRDAMTAWQHIGFIECQPWGDTSMRCFERRLPSGNRQPGSVSTSMSALARPSNAIPARPSWGSTSTNRGPGWIGFSPRDMSPSGRAATGSGSPVVGEAGR